MATAGPRNLITDVPARSERETAARLDKPFHDKVGCHRLAIIAQDGLARAIRPVHALSTGIGAPEEPAAKLKIGCAAADCLARAIMRAAEPLGGVPSWGRLWGGRGAA